MPNADYTIANTKFNTTAVENPFYETSSVRDSLIEKMKNNNIIIDNESSEESHSRTTSIA